jgi:hypothetical protein
VGGSVGGGLVVVVVGGGLVVVGFAIPSAPEQAIEKDVKKRAKDRVINTLIFILFIPI